MIALNVSPTGFAFTRNPLRISFADAGAAMFEVGANCHTFQGVVEGDAVLNLAEVAEAMIPDVPEAVPNGDPVFPIVTDLAPYTVTVKAKKTEGGQNWLCNESFVALKGGISKRSLYNLSNAGSDVFLSRFKNYKGNFFFTSHSCKWTIPIKESELCPLCFISPGCTLTIVELLASNAVELATPESGLVALDIKAIRRKFFDQFGVLANAFDIYVSGNLASRIIVERENPAKDQTKFTFRNRFGFFDVICLNGAVRNELSETEDDNNYMLYDFLTDSFITRNLWSELRGCMKMETTISNNRELGLLLELLASDEIWAENQQGVRTLVTVSAPELSYQIRLDAPLNVEIIITPADGYIEGDGSFENMTSAIRPKIFSKHFSNHFN